MKAKSSGHVTSLSNVFLVSGAVDSPTFFMVLKIQIAVLRQVIVRERVEKIRLRRVAESEETKHA